MRVVKRKIKFKYAKLHGNTNDMPKSKTNYIHKYVHPTHIYIYKQK